MNEDPKFYTASTIITKEEVERLSKMTAYEIMHEIFEKKAEQYKQLLEEKKKEG
jgi:hypothetical protein